MNAIQQSISKIMKGLTLYIFLSLATTVVTTIMTVVALLGVAGGVASSSEGAIAGAVAGGIGASAIINAIITIGIVAGLYFYYTGLKSFSLQLSDEVGKTAVNNLAIAALILLATNIISVVGFFIPGLGILTSIAGLVGFILTIIGYAKLRSSSSLNELGLAGAQKLFTGYIMAIVAIVIALIPVIGWIGALVLNIMYYIYLFNGWGMIKKSFE